MSNINDRLCALRREMNKFKIDACIIPTSDPHLSEYIADCFKYREYFSGFSGSSGTLLVSSDKAFLFTDGRYFLQAEEQLKNTEILLIKEGVQGQIGLIELCCNILDSGNCVFTDPLLVSFDFYQKLSKELAAKGIGLITKNNPVKSSSNLPIQSFSGIYELEIKLSGKKRQEKIEAIRDKLKNIGADGLILTQLDDISWLYNLRGSDIMNTPVFYAYAYISPSNAYLFANPNAVKNVSDALNDDGVSIMPYDSFTQFLQNIHETKVLADNKTVNAQIFNSLPRGTEVINRDNPVSLLKSVKNAVEIENMRRIHAYDGVALIKFMHRIKSNAHIGLSELSASEILLAFRKENQAFISNSFETIAAYAENAAIIHYTPSPETNKTIESKAALLLDSGGQYLGGTTDVTRMFILGETSPEFRRDYTLVCKAMLKLQNTHFPLGTKCAVLDGVARENLWKYGIDFRHGTGHGIGYMLSVHEGPARISYKDTTSQLLPGTIVSDEPGIYVDGKYGIRMENALLCVEDIQNEYGYFCKFEPLTLCPIDIDGLDMTILSSEDINDINKYNKLVFDKLSPLLSGELLSFLRNATRQI